MKPDKKREIVEICRVSGNTLTSDFFHEGRPHGGSGHRVAYWIARSAMFATEKNPDAILRIRFPAGTVLRAAYEAGLADRELDIAAGHVLPPPDTRASGAPRYAVWEPAEAVREKVLALFGRTAETLAARGGLRP